MDLAEAQTIAAELAPHDYYVNSYRDMERMYLPALLAKIEDVAPCRVLEVGPGWGTTAVWLKSKGHDVTVVDLMPLGTFMTAEMCETYDIKYVHHDIEDSASPEGQDLGTFDLVIMTQVIPHLSWRPDRALRHIASLLKPGAEFITSVLDVRNYKKLDSAYGHDWHDVPERHSVEKSEAVVKAMYSKKMFASLLATSFSQVEIWKPKRSTVLFARAKV
jgi:2-polyprenyl-3-methyl-5-hydroxy-6-metoxy-1,4-benzoquinol methylase